MWDPHRGPWAMLRHVRAVYNQCCGFAAGVPCGDADARRGNSSRSAMCVASSRRVSCPYDAVRAASRGRRPRRAHDADTAVSSYRDIA
jgi:hypothetical protein